MNSQQRVRVAKFFVTVQFTSLAVLAVLAVWTNSDVHNYLLFEAIAALLGIAVLIAAWTALRPSLRISPIPKANAPLIQNGIYRYVRHPMYLGVILIGFATAGYSDTTLAWVVELVLIVNLNFKARFEDSLLRELHPDSFHYQSHTSRILPCLGGGCRSDCNL